jgi:cytochrome c oxidase assembly factor CtaG
VIVFLALSALLYTLGWRRLRARTRRSPARSRRPLHFFAGWLALVAALVSPVDALGELLFSGHMVQHLLLTMVVAPLLVMSDAGTVMLWALRRNGRAVVGRLLRMRSVKQCWRSVSNPISAWSLAAGALVLWHIPSLYELAIVDERVHALEHWTFLATALLFWWKVFSPRRRLAFGTSLVYLFTAATTSGMLGAMISLSTEPWYTVHARWTPAWGLTTLEDQQLAGLIMWVPAAIIYVCAVVPIVLHTLTERSSPAPPAGTRVAI